MNKFQAIHKGRLILAIFLLAPLSTIAQQAGKQDYSDIEPTYKETYRPQFHFSPAVNWTNDPNGMVYHDGEYHLFYQYNPKGITWGHMSWGHAVSKDLVHWKHLPVALEEENNIMIFSGSAVSDEKNTSGFGSEDNPPMVAIYTGHHTDKELQDQRIAYSLDNGRTWTKYKGNPVIDIDRKNFRDPKVIWYEAGQKWVMAVSLPTERKVRFYESENLKEWNLLSEYGPAGSTTGIWECPDLFPLNVQGTDVQKWVLQVDVGGGAPAGDSGSQYFVGDFDGKTFKAEDQFVDTDGQGHWVDYGADFYAVQSWSNVPDRDGKRLWLAWMNNWQYANNIPTQPWRSAMTEPREVSLVKRGDRYFITQQPVEELQQLRKDHKRIGNETIRGSSKLMRQAGISGKTLEIKAVFRPGDAESFGMKVRKGGKQETLVGYEPEQQKLFVDRTDAGVDNFTNIFDARHEGPLKPDADGLIRLHILVDWSSVEVFGNGGETVISDQVFADPGSEGVELFSYGGSTELISLDAWTLGSIWSDYAD